ncbi:MAG: hypothetical protein AAF802_26555 [Planctomycetota bacterium]
MSTVSFSKIKSFPKFSIAAGVIVATTLTTAAVTTFSPSPLALGALGMLPLAAAVVDAVRLLRPAKTHSLIEPENDRPDAEQWMAEQSEALTKRETELQSLSLSLQQWLQFPPAEDFRVNPIPNEDSSSFATPKIVSNASDQQTQGPLSSQDKELLTLIDSKTKELFERIKADAYRTESGGTKSLDVVEMRSDILALVSDVTAIYRPNDPAPFLKTNAEAVCRAVGRGALRLLVAAEHLPGGISSYDFQSIYQFVRRGVQAYGVYRAAKPYLDVASGLWFAGRLASVSNPVTYVAWWAASKATTYGASKLSEHVIDQQAVGLIRQLVEIVAIEVASVYSPQVRFRDVHWVYGVELVQMLHELDAGDSARLAAMRQIASLNILDEYGRMSLMRQLATGVSRFPSGYEPERSLPAAERTIVAERLEAFLLDELMLRVAKTTHAEIAESSIARWQSSAAERLSVQFRASDEKLSTDEEAERTVWALAAFCLEHLQIEPESLVELLAITSTWNHCTEAQREAWLKDLRIDPPFLYHPPSIKPEGLGCQRFLDDLARIAGSRIPQSAEQFDLIESKVRMTAYYLRSPADELISRFENELAKHFRASSSEVTLSSVAIRALVVFRASDELNELPVHCYFEKATLVDEEQAFANVLRSGDQILCFQDDDETLSVVANCSIKDAKIEKLSGYVRSDCRVKFPNGRAVVIAGSTFSGYEATFGMLTAEDPTQADGQETPNV